MRKSMDSQLAEYTDNLLEGNSQTPSYSKNRSEEFASLQEIVVKLNTLGKSTQQQASQEKILFNIKKDWDRSGPQKKSSWQSSRQRQSKFAFAVVFATIVIVAIIFPQLDTSGEGLPATAQGGNLAPVLFALIAAGVAAYLFSKKKNKK